MAMPGLTGIDLLQRVKELSPECEVLLLTGEATVGTAVQAMKLGAYDFLSKPFSLRNSKPSSKKRTSGGG